MAVDGIGVVVIDSRRAVITVGGIDDLTGSRQDAAQITEERIPAEGAA